MELICTSVKAFFACFVVCREGLKCREEFRTGEMGCVCFVFLNPPASGEVGRELTLTLVIGQQAGHVMCYSSRILKHVHRLTFLQSVFVRLVVIFVLVVVVG